MPLRDRIHILPSYGGPRRSVCLLACAVSVLRAHSRPENETRRGIAGEVYVVV